jgi:protein-disulfide isomerase
MTLRWPVCLLAATLSGFLAAATHAAETVTPAEKSMVEQIIHDYILQHPEIVSQALQSAQDKRKAQIEDINRAAVAGNRRALLDDPMSLVVGNVRGDVAIVEFFDYRCGYCKQVEPALEALVQGDGGIRIAYKELPILGSDSRYAARVALAARQQGKYENFHAAMMAARGQINQKTVFDIAAAAGIDVDQVKTDMQAVEIDDTIERNLALAQTLGIRGTPTFVIGDEIVFGAIDLATMKQKVAAVRGSNLRTSSVQAAGGTTPR